MGKTHHRDEDETARRKELRRARDSRYRARVRAARDGSLTHEDLWATPASGGKTEAARPAPPPGALLPRR